MLKTNWHGRRFLFLGMKHSLLVPGLILFLVCCKESGDQTIVGKETSKNQVEETSKTTSNFSFEIVDFNGLKPYLSTDNDSIYVVNFWATWCKPCVKEMPYFQRLAKEYSSKKVKLLLVSLDFPNKYESLLQPFIEENNIDSEVIALNDPNSNAWIPQIDESWSGAIPATIIFNKDERKFYEQSFTYEELENQLKSVINN